jgi:hypothetical protein
VSHLLSSPLVEVLVNECSGVDGADGELVVVEGIVHKYSFQRTKIAEHAATIATMLAELPIEFRSGWTFLNACDDRHGRQWTGEHRMMEALFALGIAAGKARWLMPREMWDVLPGGMPFVVVEL